MSSIYAKYVIVIYPRTAGATGTSPPGRWARRPSPFVSRVRPWWRVVSDATTFPDALSLLSFPRRAAVQPTCRRRHCQLGLQQVAAIRIDGGGGGGAARCGSNNDGRTSRRHCDCWPTGHDAARVARRFTRMSVGVTAARGWRRARSPDFPRSRQKTRAAASA